MSQGTILHPTISRHYFFHGSHMEKKHTRSNLAVHASGCTYTNQCTRTHTHTLTNTGSHMHSDVKRQLYLYPCSNKSICSLVYFLWLCPCNTESLHSLKTGGETRGEERRGAGVGSIGGDECPMAFSSSVAHLSMS